MQRACTRTGMQDCEIGLLWFKLRCCSYIATGHAIIENCCTHNINGSMENTPAICVQLYTVVFMYVHLTLILPGLLCRCSNCNHINFESFTDHLNILIRVIVQVCSCHSMLYFCGQPSSDLVWNHYIRSWVWERDQICNYASYYLYKFCLYS